MRQMYDPKEIKALAKGVVDTELVSVKADIQALEELNISSRLTSLEGKLPAAPETAGTYILQVVIDSEGNATYSWVENSLGGNE